MGLRSLPFFKAKKGWQFAGGGLSADGGGGGGSLPIATTETLGTIRVGSGLNVTNDGTLSNAGLNMSLTPHVIGKFLGRDLYCVAISRSDLKNGQTIIDVSSYNIDQLLTVFGVVNVSNTRQRAIPAHTSYFDFDNPNLYVNLSDITTSDSDGYIVIFYTIQEG